MSGWETIYRDEDGHDLRLLALDDGSGYLVQTTDLLRITAEQADAIREVLRPRTEQVPLSQVKGRTIDGQGIGLAHATFERGTVALYTKTDYYLTSVPFPDGADWTEVLVEVDALPTEPEPEPVTECTEDRRLCLDPANVQVSSACGHLDPTRTLYCTRPDGHIGTHAACIPSLGDHNRGLWGGHQ